MKIQNDSYSCGVFAVMNAAKCFNVDLTKKQILKYSKTTSKNGTSEKGIIRALEKNNFVAKEFTFDRKSLTNKFDALLYLKGALTDNKPVIICVDNYSHWCVVVGMLGTKFIVYDSDNEKNNAEENGVQVLAASALVDRWNGDNGFYGIVVSTE